MKLRAVLLSPTLWLALMLFAGAGLVIVGIALILGAGWALISAGAFLIWLSVFIRKGLN